MRHDIIMPALGMAQDTGTLIAWHKAEGEAVTQGETLFEVETDKTTMEVEAPVSGYLVGLSAQDGEEVPVGKVIAAISDRQEAPEPAPQASSDTAQTPASDTALPSGKPIIMPVLGMAQDTGTLVRWLKAVGDSVQADDILFEVETDKSVVEVQANETGYLVARLAAAGDDVPTGETIAIIADEATSQTVDRPYQAEASATAATPAAAPSATAVNDAPKPARPAPGPVKRPKAAPTPGAKVLASPKLKRLAHQAGFDLALLAQTGLAQPFLSRDFEALKQANDAPRTQANPGVVTTRLTAQVSASEFDAFVDWATQTLAGATEDSVIATFAGASLMGQATVRIDRYDQSHAYDTEPQLSKTTATENDPDLIVQDLRGTHITSVELPAGNQPIIAMMGTNEALTLTLVCASDRLSGSEAAALLNNFAGRMADPIRHLF